MTYRGWMALREAGVLAGLTAVPAVVFGLAVFLQARDRPGPAPTSPRFVPAEDRFAGLSTPIAEGLRIDVGYPGIRAISAAYFGTRKLRVGFLHLGARREAVVRGLRIVVDAPASGFGSPAAKRDAPAPFVAQAQAMADDVKRALERMPVSGLEVTDVQFLFSGTGTGFPVGFQCGRATPRPGGPGLRVELTDGVRFAACSGAEMTASRAFLSVENGHCRVEAAHALVQEPRGLTRLPRARFTLRALTDPNRAHPFSGAAPR